MAKVFKLFCVSISVILILQLAAANEKTPPSKDGTESNGQNGEEHTATFLKNMKSIKNSKPVQIVKGVSGVVEKHLSNFSKDFESKLNAESKKQVNDENSFIPNFVTNNVFLPGKVAVETSFDTLSQPVGKVLSSFKNTYDDGLAKSKQVADKPVAFLKASKSIVENTIGGMFGKASSIWSWGKNDKADKSEKTNEDTILV
ncbi:hypothetical protein ACI65C_008702 [Semiaphis heraclei]